MHTQVTRPLYLHAGDTVHPVLRIKGLGLRLNKPSVRHVTWGGGAQTIYNGQARTKRLFLHNIGYITKVKREPVAKITLHMGIQIRMTYFF